MSERTRGHEPGGSGLDSPKLTEPTELTELTELRQREARLRAVLESLPVAILTTTESGAVESANVAAERLFGKSTAELCGANVRALVADADTLRDGVLGAVHDVIATRGATSTFPAELIVTDFRVDGARTFTWVVRDITDRKELERELREAHKMEAIGQLASGIAHDFNNLLTVILGESELLLAALPEDDPTVPSIESIRDAGAQAQALTRQLLAFGRKSILEPDVLDLNGVVRESAKSLRRLVGEHIALETALEPGLAAVRVDANQLAQALMNLAVNARDAMPEGGTLRIATASVDVGSPTVFGGPGIRPGRYARLSVTDIGRGMTADVRAGALQPFFTTKTAGAGSGLGLAVVHGVVSQSGGYVDLKSEPGVGTTVDVYLPAAETKHAAPEEIEPSRASG